MICMYCTLFTNVDQSQWHYNTMEEMMTKRRRKHGKEHTSTWSETAYTSNHIHQTEIQTDPADSVKEAYKALRHNIIMP